MAPLHRPLAVSMGDPAGVGLEVALMALRDAGAALPAFALIADPDAVAQAAAVVGFAGPIRVIGSAANAQAGQACVLPLPLTAPLIKGKPDPAHALAITTCIELGVALTMSGQTAGLVTLPIAKATLYEAGFSFPGHTEFIAHLTSQQPMVGPRGPVMMLAGKGLKAALATIHTPLAKVSETLTKDRIERAARVTLAALRADFGIANPRLALAGLNPHAGEGGGIGREEVEVINPVAALLRQEGHIVSDALPADTLFHEEARAGYDAVLAMYHDQGLIPVKTLDFWGAVNVTLGLPIVRTSPDHGTAFDLAGKGQARADSFIAAVHMAASMAASRAAS
jgi:4-hydroxythreonine-4-phosphate dehydrogenase